MDANIRHSSDEMSMLDAAVLMGQLQPIRTILEHGVEVNNADSSSDETALHKAFYHDKANLIIDLFLSLCRSRHGHANDRLFHAPVVTGQPAATLLLHDGAAKHALDRKGRSPLHCATDCRYVTATHTLLEAGVGTILRADGAYKQAPLDVAATFRRVEVARELVQHGTEIDAASNAFHLTALHHAAMNDRAGVAEALLEAKSSVTALAFVSETLLHTAAHHLCLEVMHALLQHGATVRWLQDNAVDRCNEPRHEYRSTQRLEWPAQRGRLSL